MIFKQISILLICLGCTRSLFVPEQLTTLLSFIYTNIPPVRKGTDSRVGFGFRLGPNADFQVMLELGPQENTQPVGPQPNAKRETYSTEDWQEKLLQQEEHQPNPQVDQDVVNHLRQLFKKQEKSNENQ